MWSKGEFWVVFIEVGKCQPMVGLPDMTSSKSQQKFLKLLREDILKLDLAELDFGIYRILNYRRSAVEEFLTQKLPKAMSGAIKDSSLTRSEDLQNRAKQLREDLDKIAKDVFGLQNAFDGDALRPPLRELPKGKEYLETAEELNRLIAKAAFGEDEEERLYNALYTFFSRYYEDGDFLPQPRRGKNARFSVPYQGEDVHFSWRGRGSHYVKTSEQLRSYAFKLDGAKVRFEFVSADLEKDNIKGDKRFLVPTEELKVDNKQVTIFFEYRPLTNDEAKRYGKNPQEDIIEEKLSVILPKLQGSSVNKDQLEKHMRRYARKNTSDYFVHPNLGEFLRGELDYYLKNEFLEPDALTSPEAMADKFLKYQVLRKIATDIITFLDQLESFQARLFEKRRFVLKTDYLLPVRLLSDELKEKVSKNKAQHEAWQELFAVTAKIDKSFLDAHPTLVVDTKHFDEAFKYEVLALFDDLDEATDGTLIHAENYGALRTLEAKYAGKVKVIYIDPPYNTGGDGFLYKDDFSRHSTWLTMMEERLVKSEKLLSIEGVLLISIDDIEQHHLQELGRDVLQRQFMTNLVWKSRQNVDSRAVNNVSNDHEFVIVFGEKLRGAAKDLEKYDNPDNDLRGPWMSDNMVGLATRARRPNLHFHILVGLLKELEEKENSFVIKIDDKTFEIARDKLEGETPKLNTKVFVCLTIEQDRALSAGLIPAPIDNREILPSLYTCPDKGWRYDPSSMAKRIIDNRILWPKESDGRPRKKSFLREMKSEFTGFSSVVGYTASATKEIVSLLGTDVSFLFPKPTSLLVNLFEQLDDEQSTILDYFGGTGTTSHSVIKLNREANSKRKFVVVEMGEHFETILEPRVKKVMYSPDWENAKPVSETDFPLGAYPDWVTRSPRLVKVLRLESYDDSLNALELPQEQDARSKGLQTLFGDKYFLEYMLPSELDDSEVFLNTERLEAPFDYKLKIHTPEGVKEQAVDIVETFNLLMGFHVKRVFKLLSGRDYVCVEAEDTSGLVLVLWRNLADLDPAAEREFLEKTLELSKYHRLYVNGDSALPRAQSLDGEFKNRLLARAVGIVA
jgi:adenine-specific DNA-methyltransferase